MGKLVWPSNSGQNRLGSGRFQDDSADPTRNLAILQTMMGTWNKEKYLTEKLLTSKRKWVLYTSTKTLQTLLFHFWILNKDKCGHKQRRRWIQFDWGYQCNTVRWTYFHYYINLKLFLLIFYHYPLKLDIPIFYNEMITYANEWY
jgi:hypothetical protein